MTGFLLHGVFFSARPCTCQWFVGGLVELPGEPQHKVEKNSTVTEFRTTSLWVLCILCNKQTEGILGYNGLKGQVWLSFVSD